MPQKQKRKCPSPKKHCPGQGKTQDIQAAPAPTKHCPNQGKIHVLQEAQDNEKSCKGQGKTQVLQEAPAPKKHSLDQGKTPVLQEAPATKKHYPGKRKTLVLQEAPALKKQYLGQGKTQVLQEAPAPKKNCPGQGKTQVLQEAPAPKKKCPGQAKTQVLQEAPDPKKQCLGQGKNQVLPETPTSKKKCHGQGKTQVLQEALVPNEHWPDQEKTELLQEAPAPKKKCGGQGKTQVLQEAPAPEKHWPDEGKTQVIQKTQAPATKRKLLLSSSSPLVVTPVTDSASQSPNPLEGSERAVSTDVATDKSNPRSSEGTKCKSKKKHLSSQAPSSTIQSPKDALTKIASRLVNYIIEMHKMQNPIKKNDMLKMVKRKYQKCFPELLVRAAFNIEVIFGMELKEVGCTKHCYSLVSKMNLPYNGMLKRGRGFPKTGLLMNLLGVIFMKGNSAPEEKIWEFLNKMKIYDGQRHFLFGEPRKLITQDLVQLKYLEYRQIPDSDPPQYEFLWGPRAYAETSKMKVLEFWAKINDTIPSAFQARYEEALREEEEGADIIISLSDSTSTTDSENSTPLIMTSPIVIEDDDEEDPSL